MSDPVKLPEKMFDIFDDRPIGFISTIRTDGQISVNPVSVVRDGDLLKVSTLKLRKKYQNLLADNRVAICVPQRDNPGRFIEVRGWAEVVDDTDRSFVDHVAQIFMNVDTFTLEPPEYERVVVIIHPEQIWAPDRPF